MDRNRSTGWEGDAGALESRPKKALRVRRGSGEPVPVHTVRDMVAIDTLLACSAGAWCLPPCILFAEVLASLPRPYACPAATSPRPRLAVVVPAHDEEHGIAATVASVLPQLAPGDRLLVVADNCTDGTAAVARSSGAEVVERVDPARRGKGHAMAAGVRELERDPPAVVVFVDADCLLGEGALDRLARIVATSGRPAQADYRMEVPEHAIHAVRLLQFAWILRNHTRALGLQRLAGCCQLHGSGMAIPWGALQSVCLATGDIVEDLRLGLELARAGFAPEACPEAMVRSTFPATPRGRSHQRRRWEHGHLATMVRRVPGLLLRSVVLRDLRLAGMALDVLVPPLALLSAMVLLHVVLATWLVVAGGSALALVLATAAALLLVTAVLAGWLRDGTKVVPATAFLLAPLHMLRRLPSQLAFLFSRPRWQRAERTVP